MVMRYRYSEWDGTQEIPPLDPDDILNALTDDLMNFGDLQHALRNLLQRGMRNPMGDRTQGLRDLLQQLRQQRRQTLDRFNLSSAFEDLARRLEQIIDKERGTLDQRLSEALGDEGERGEAGEQGEGESPEGEQSGDSQAGQRSRPQGQRGQQTAQQAGSKSGQRQSGQSGQQGGQSGQQGQQGGQGGEGPSSGSGQGGDNQQFAEMLKNIVERKRNFLEGLPQDLGGQMKELQNYEFMDPEAAAEFQELMA